MKKKNIILILVSIVITFSCSYNSEDDLTEEIIIDDVVTYDANVKSIIDTNCLSCHNSPPTNGAPMSLTTYNDVRQAVESRNLIGRISSNEDGPIMPLGGQMLPQNLIDLIIQWEAEGLIEN